MLRSLIIKTDCEVQLYAIESCWFVLILLYHAISVNVVCTLVFNGIKQLKWRQLSPTGIGFRTRLNEQGDLMKGDNPRERSERVAAAIRRFEKLAILQIIAGLSFFIGWVISVFLLKT